MYDILFYNAIPGHSNRINAALRGRRRPDCGAYVNLPQVARFGQSTKYCLAFFLRPGSTLCQSTVVHATPIAFSLVSKVM
jgi:hypothetical protein